MKCFRERILDLNVNTNNGLEKKNKDFKYEFSSQHRNNTLNGMVTDLVKNFYQRITLHTQQLQLLKKFFSSIKKNWSE